MRIYAACLASYNNGRLHGRWIAADEGADHIRDEIAAMLRESPFPNVRVECPDCEGEGESDRVVMKHANGCETTSRMLCATCEGARTVPSAEEYAIHDYDDLPSSWGEHPDLDKLAAYCEAAAELSEEEREAFDAWIDNEGDTPGDLDAFREVYQGCHSTLTDWAESWHDDVGTLAEVPDEIARYFDFESWARDCKLGGDIWTHEGSHGVHVFNNH